MGTLSRFNLNAYFALDAILRSSTLTEAAQCINLSQPAMSLALKRLRELFNDELVRYRHGGAEFSPLAVQLRPLVADILQRSREVLDMSRAFDPQSEVRTLTIAAPGATLPFFLPRLTAQLALEAPGITLAAIPSPPEDAAKSRIDLSVVPQWAVTLGNVSRPLFEESFSCLVHSDFVASEMDEATYLAMDHGGLSQDQEEQFWSEDSPVRALLRSRRVVTTVRKAEALPHLAINHRLVITAPARFAQYHAASSVWLASISAPAAFTPTTLVAEAPQHRADEPAVRWLMRRLVALGDTLAS